MIELNETQTKILNYLKDIKQRELQINDRNGWQTLFFKTQINNNFDFVYCIDYIRNIASIDKKPEYLATIDRKTKAIYFASYSLNRHFETYNPETHQHETPNEYKTIRIAEVNDKLNEHITKELNKLAEQIENDQEPDECNEHTARDRAEQIYYDNNENILNFAYLQQDTAHADTSRLLQYIQDPAGKVANIIASSYEDTVKHIKYTKMMHELTNKYLKEIETSNEYKYFRQATEIKNSIPQDAKQITVFYEMNNGETLTGKYEARDLARMPYYRTGENAHFSGYGLEYQARTKLEDTNGRSDDDIKIKNIIKLTYKGKTIYTNPEKGAN